MDQHGAWEQSSLGWGASLATGISWQAFCSSRKAVRQSAPVSAVAGTERQYQGSKGLKFGGLAINCLPLSQVT